MQGDVAEVWHSCWKYAGRSVWIGYQAVLVTGHKLYGIVINDERGR